MTIHVTWRCSWCRYVNVRLNAGLDHCSACGAETLTQFNGEDILSIRHTFRHTHLDCVASTSCKTSAATISYDARGNPLTPCETSN